MTEQDFKEIITKIRKNLLIEVKEGGGGTIGVSYRGTIITQNKEVYSYSHSFLNLTGEFQEEWLVSKQKNLSTMQYDKVINFIETEIVNKEFLDNMIFDASFDVIVNYKNIYKQIKNNKGHGDNLGLYDKAKQLIKDLLKKE